MFHFLVLGIVKESLINL